MGFTQKVISVFLASPGDLEDERKAVRRAVEEFNKSLSSMLGYHIELVGWEETIAGTGRPQHLINKDLERCDLFLGMLNRRWGTPPDNKGKFTSGFEEEFTLSVKRNEETKSPEIALFFKEVPAELMEDPGADLNKVLKFRDSIIAEKKFLFKEFKEKRDIEMLARQCIIEFIKRVKEQDKTEESKESTESNAVRTQAEADDVSSGATNLSPLSGEGFTFLENFVEKLRTPDSLDSVKSSEVARFRLLANTVAKAGNDVISLGAHDINILFRAFIDGEVFGEKELLSLIRLGLQSYEFKNVPIWCWYSKLKNSEKINHYDPTLKYSIMGRTDSEKTGAIDVLTALGTDISSFSQTIGRDEILSSWLSEDSGIDVKVSALRYLYSQGIVDDLAHIEHIIELNEHGASQTAFEAMLNIKLRFGRMTSAQTQLIESQVDNLDPNLLISLLENIKQLDVAILELGLDHKHYQVRLSCMKALHYRNEIDIRTAEKLCEDRSVFIRKEAVDLLSKLGKKLSDDEVKSILIPERNVLRSGLSVAGVEQQEGIFEQYRLKALKSLSTKDLAEEVSKASFFDHTPYFALMEKSFDTKAEELRRNIDDGFSHYFDEITENMGSKFQDENTRVELTQRAYGIKEFECQKLTRRGLTLLSKQKCAQDISRLRSVLSNKRIGITVYDLEIFRSFGSWADIPLLANVNYSQDSYTLLAPTVSDGLEDSIARTIAVLAKSYSVSDLLSIKMPANILSKVIYSCSIANFKRIRGSTLQELLEHKSDTVRQIAALKAVMAFTKKDVTKLLKAYLKAKGFRYYNVIHWLDLGVSMTRTESRRVANHAIEAII